MEEMENRDFYIKILAEDLYKKLLWCEELDFSEDQLKEQINYFFEQYRESYNIKDKTEIYELLEKIKEEREEREERTKGIHNNNIDGGRLGRVINNRGEGNLETTEEPSKDRGDER